MSPSSDYSTEFDRSFTLRPRASRWLLIWWCGLHGVAASGGLLLPIPGVPRALVITAVMLHAIWRLPRRPPRWLAYSNGVWSLPGHDNAVLTCFRGTRSGSWWVVLVLIGRDRRSRFLLLRDQLDAREWYRLNALLRG